jgi:hypothetical protein
LFACAPSCNPSCVPRPWVNSNWLINFRSLLKSECAPSGRRSEERRRSFVLVVLLLCFGFRAWEVQSEAPGLNADPQPPLGSPAARTVRVAPGGGGCGYAPYAHHAAAWASSGSRRWFHHKEGRCTTPPPPLLLPAPFGGEAPRGSQLLERENGVRLA